jgi:hypothetical protein
MTGSRLFVAVIFAILAVSFFASTYTLITEFGKDNWFSLAAVYSHGFLFFPTIGLVALIAFYTPATIFIDLYWHHVNSGKLRLLVGFILIASFSVYVASVLSARNIITDLLWQKEPGTAQQTLVPALWELHPDTLNKDTGTPANCVNTDQLCSRQPILRSLKILRTVSQSRTGLTAFSRNCSHDPLLEDPPSGKLLRYCFPILRKVDAQSCCFAQERFSRELSEMFASEEQHSQTGYIDALTLPFKVFFMLMVFTIGFLLAAWRSKLDRFYESYMPQVENGALIGAAAMLFWPVTNQAFLQSAAVLYGPYSGSIYQNALGPVFSLVFGFWALLILFFFFRHQEKTVELWVKVLGGIASVIAAVRYEEIINYAVRFAGSGAYELTFVVLAIIGLIVYLSSYFWPRRKSSDAPKPPQWKP